MNYQLSFLDEAQNSREVWEADFEAEHTAICWMWIVGGVWALKRDWTVMELTCRRCRAGPINDCPRAAKDSTECCIARIPARDLRPSAKSERQQPRARPIILVAGQDDEAAIAQENAIFDSGLALGASLPDYASAAAWLSANSPDAAIVDVELKDKSCVELAKRLTAREIPFIAVSGHAANAAGIHRIFRPAPWLVKPITSAGLQLALRSIL